LARTPRTHEIVSNTSPILYLHQIDRLDLLPLLFARVIVPPAVLAELEAGRENGVSVPVLESLDWIQVRPPDAILVSKVSTNLGMGEREVLALALQTEGSLVILDDKAARQLAISHDIQLTGTLGLLVRGKKEGRVEAVLPLLNRLQELGFRLHARTRSVVLSLCGEG
jgi:predicted nucleic acid-binding protein